MVSEQDYLCASAHNQKMVSYATGSSSSVLEELGFGSIEVVKTLSVHGPACSDKRQFCAKTTVST